MIIAEYEWIATKTIQARHLTECIVATEATQEESGTSSGSVPSQVEVTGDFRRAAETRKIGVFGNRVNVRKRRLISLNS